MPTTLDDLKRWFEVGKKEKATHMIVVCDTFDHEDYPVYVKSHEKVKTRINDYKKAEMQKVMEVYSYKKSWDEQSRSETRVWDLT